MKRCLAILAITFCFAALGSAADPQLIGLMMPDAQVLAGGNVTQVLSSPYGQYLLAQASLNDPNFQQILQATGFDPTRDISQVVAASPGLAGQPRGLAAARGTFDVAAILAFLKTTGATVDQSSGVPVITTPDGQHAVAFLDNTLALAGDLDSVTAAIPRKSSPSALDPALIAKANALSASQDAWVVSTVAISSTPSLPVQLNLSALKNIQQSSVGVKFGTSVNVSAEAIEDTPQDANALADIVRLVVALAQTSQSNPQVAQLTAILKSLSISTKGAALELSLSIPEDVMEQLSPVPMRAQHRALAERQK